MAMLRTKSTFFYQQNYTVQKNGKKRYKRFFVEDEAEFDIPLVSSSDEFPVAFLVKQKDENTGKIIEKEIRLYKGHLFKKSRNTLENLMTRLARRRIPPVEKKPPQGEFYLGKNYREAGIEYLQEKILRSGYMLFEKEDGKVEVWYLCKIPTYFFYQQKDGLHLNVRIEDVQNCFFHNDDFSSTDERDYYGYLPSEKEAMFALEKKEYAEYYSVSEEDVQIHDLENEIICLVPEIHEKYPNIRQEEQAKLLQSLEKFLYKLEISSTLTDTEKQCYQQTKKFRDDLIRI